VDVALRRYGAFLRALRESRHLSLEDVERATRDQPEPVGKSLLSRLENGRARLTLPKLVALARVYQVRVGALAERLELELLAASEPELPGGGSPHGRLREAARAGRAGRIYRALALYQATRDSAEEELDRVTASLGVAQALAAAARWRAARLVLEDLLEEHELGPDALAWAAFLLCRCALGLGQPLLARGAWLALAEIPRPWPGPIEAAAPTLEASVLESRGRLPEAEEAWTRARDTFRRADDPLGELDATVRLAGVLRRRGDLGRARRLARDAGARARREGFHQVAVQAALEEARVERLAGRPAAARLLLREARRTARRLSLHAEVFASYAEEWRLARDGGRDREARSALRSLRRLARLLPATPPDCRDVLPLLAPGGPASRVRRDDDAHAREVTR